MVMDGRICICHRGVAGHLSLSNTSTSINCFRNSGDGRCERVTELAGVGDDRFSQGVTVGDLDNDGFADLYVANIGRNRLYHNNGDGTFSDITDQAKTAGDQWSTSCVLADLNGDSWPDLYTVNYLAGEDVFERICEADGKRRSCSPRLFPAAQGPVVSEPRNGRFRRDHFTVRHRSPERQGTGNRGRRL